MAGASKDSNGEGVRFVHEDDGTVTAIDEETNVASFGDTKAAALRMLAEALELHAGGGEPVTDDDLESWGLDPDDVADEATELPDVLRQ